MSTCGRRTYHNSGEFVTDLRMIASRRKEIRSSMQGRVIAPTFHERRMLVATEVNRCRYCLYAHVREELSQGIPEEESQALGKPAGSRLVEGAVDLWDTATQRKQVLPEREAQYASLDAAFTVE